MSSVPSEGRYARREVPPEGHVDAWAIGAFVFAAALMIMGGIFQMLMGAAALIQNGFFGADPDSPYGRDPTIWGWLHLAGGAIVFLAGIYVFKGSLWARIVGIAAAMLGVLILFPAIPTSPFWAVLIIALNILVIWALTAYAGDLTRDV
jgi:hypothetical protein